MKNNPIAFIVFCSLVLSSGLSKRAQAYDISGRDVVIGAATFAVGTVGGYLLGKRAMARYFAQQQAAAGATVPCITDHEKKLSDFIGQEMVVNQVSTFIDAVANPEIYKELGAKKPNGLLIQGPPGNGKTLLAQIIAAELDANLISISCYSFVGLQPVEVEGRLAYLFQCAKEQSLEKRTVLFVDDLDIVLQDSGAFGEKMLRSIVEFFETLEEGHAFTFIGAIQDALLLDKRLLARGSIERVNIVFPNKKGRKALLEHFLQGVNLDPTISLPDFIEKWAHELTRGNNWSTEYLKLFVEKGVAIARQQKSDHVTNKHFERAMLELVSGLEENVDRPQKHVRTVAYHEAGHALAALLTGAPVPRVTIVAQEGSWGLTFHEDPLEFIVCNNRMDLLRRLMIVFGGFCAEKLMCGQVTPGAAEDLQQANRSISQLVQCWGMGEGLAGVTYEHILSDVVKAKFDEAHLRIVQICMSATERLLRENKDKLEILASALLEKETLTEQEVYELVGQPNNIVPDAWLV